MVMNEVMIESDECPWCEWFVNKDFYWCEVCNWWHDRNNDGCCQMPDMGRDGPDCYENIRGE